MAEHAAEYAGLPMGLEGEELIVEPSYPWAKVFNQDDRIDLETLVTDDGYSFRGEFWSHRRRCSYTLWEKGGKVRAISHAAMRPLDLLVHTIGCSNAWGIEQEARAVQSLGELVGHAQFKQYMLVGAFLETSKRSDVTYLFRRLRPTLALRSDTKRDEVRFLAALCMHPIGFYADSFAGAMCPTDDVIAHLQLMRGDEVMFWRRCNQHAADRPEAGLQ